MGPEESVLAIKRKISSLKDEKSKLEGILSEKKSQMQVLIDQMKSMGINPDKIDEAVSTAEQSYQESLTLVNNTLSQIESSLKSAEENIAKMPKK